MFFQWSQDDVTVHILVSEIIRFSYDSTEKTTYLFTRTGDRAYIPDLDRTHYDTLVYLTSPRYEVK